MFFFLGLMKVLYIIFQQRCQRRVMYHPCGVWEIRGCDQHWWCWASSGGIAAQWHPWEIRRSWDAKIKTPWYITVHCGGCDNQSAVAQLAAVKKVQVTLCYEIRRCKGRLTEPGDVKPTRGHRLMPRWLRRFASLREMCRGWRSGCNEEWACVDVCGCRMM